MLGGSCSPCCGCSLQTLQQIYDTIAASSCSITLAGTAPHNEAGAILALNGGIICRTGAFAGAISPGTLAYVQNALGLNGENVLTQRYRGGEDPIGTFAMAFAPSLSKRPAGEYDDYAVACFRYEGTLLRIEVLFQFAQTSTSDNVWPGTKCNIFRTSRVDVFGQSVFAYGVVQTRFVGPDVVPSAGGFGQPVERSLGYVKADIPGGAWASDLGHSWSGEPNQSNSIIYNAQATSPTTFDEIGNKYEVAFPQQSRLVYTYGWTNGPPSPMEYSYTWKYAGLSAIGNECALDLVGSESSTLFSTYRQSSVSVTPTVTITPPPP